MKRTTRTLRILSALVVALLLHAASPHLHGPGSGSDRELDLAFQPNVSAPDYTTDHTTDDAPAQPELSADDRHDGHSSTVGADEHPCALCRAAQGRLHAAPAPTPFRLDPQRSRLVAPTFALLRAEQLFARRHPARAPPLA